MTAEYQTPQPGEPTYMDSVVAGLSHMVTVLSEETMHHLDNDQSPEGAARLLFDVREVRKALADVEASIEATTAQRMTGKTLDVPGFVVERRGGAKATEWENDRIAWAVTADLAMDGNGVMDDAALGLIGLVRDRLLLCARPSWRTTPIKALGINPSDFCTYTTGRHTVQVTRQVEAEAVA